MAQEPPGLRPRGRRRLSQRHLVLAAEALELDGGPHLPQALGSLPRRSRPPRAGSARRRVHLKRRRRQGRGDFLPEAGLTTGLSHAGAECPGLPEGHSTLPREAEGLSWPRAFDPPTLPACSLGLEAGDQLPLPLGCPVR